MRLEVTAFLQFLLTLTGADRLPISELIEFKPTGPTVEWESDIEDDTESDDPNSPNPPLDLSKDLSSLPTLPIWIWSDNSCSLDAMMMIILLACLLMPDEMKAIADSSESSLEFKTLVGAICGYPGTWEEFMVNLMTALRELIRQNLLDRPNPIKLTLNTPLDSTFNLIVPQALRTLHISTLYQCTNATCARLSANSGGHPDGLRWSKVTTPEQLSFRGAFQGECESVQSLVDRMVFSVYYNADLYRKTSFITIWMLTVHITPLAEMRAASPKQRSLPLKLSSSTHFPLFSFYGEKLHMTKHLEKRK